MSADLWAPDTCAHRHENSSEVSWAKALDDDETVRVPAGITNCPVTRWFATTAPTTTPWIIRTSLPSRSQISISTTFDTTQPISPTRWRQPVEQPAAFLDYGGLRRLGRLSLRKADVRTNLRYSWHSDEGGRPFPTPSSRSRWGKTNCLWASWTTVSLNGVWAGAFDGST